jgi:hypothetical protein
MIWAFFKGEREQKKEKKRDVIALQCCVIFFILQGYTTTVKIFPESDKKLPSSQN